MIDEDALMNIAVYEQPYQKEKDYVEELFLSSIYASASGLVFKGGTAISKFYGSVRFSDDLDFSIAHGRRNAMDVPAEMNKIVGRLSNEYPIKVMRKKDSPGMLVYELSIRGPLFGKTNKYQHLKLEIDKNASVISRVNVYRRDPVYPDLKPYVAVVMNDREILAEKVVTLLYRHNLKARDLYDTYFLLQRGTSLEVAMIDKKMREYGHVFTGKRLRARADAIGDIWDRELRRLLPEKEFVRYSDAKRYVIRRFADADMV